MGRVVVSDPSKLVFVPNFGNDDCLLRYSLEWQEYATFRIHELASGYGQRRKPIWLVFRDDVTEWLTLNIRQKSKIRPGFRIPEDNPYIQMASVLFGCAEDAMLFRMKWL